MPLSRYVCIGLVSAAALLFQVSQTRLFSASYGYHLAAACYVVAALSVASRLQLAARQERSPQPT